MSTTPLLSKIVIIVVTSLSAIIVTGLAVFTLAPTLAKLNLQVPPCAVQNKMWKSNYICSSVYCYLLIIDTDPVLPLVYGYELSVIWPPTLATYLQASNVPSNNNKNNKNNNSVCVLAGGYQPMFKFKIIILKYWPNPIPPLHPLLLPLVSQSTSCWGLQSEEAYKKYTQSYEYRLSKKA